MDKATEDRINAPYVYAEYPKMLYHPDGRQIIAADKDEEDHNLSGDFCPTPDAALKARIAIDKRTASSDIQRAAIAGRPKSATSE